MSFVNVGGILGSVKFVDDFSSTFNSFNESITNSSNKVKAIGDTLSNTGSTLTRTVTVPIVAFGTSVVKAAADFESSFTGVKKTVDATDQEFQQLNESLREMAAGDNPIPINVNELNAIAESAGQLGIKTENIIGFTETMAALGVTTNLSSTQAAESLARLANITQMPQTEFERLGSTVVDLGNNFATTEQEIVAMGLRLAGVGNQIGLTEAEILAFATTMSSVGILVEAGGSAMSRVFADMAVAVEQGGEAVSLFAQVAGMSVDDFVTAFQTDAASAIESFILGLNRMQENGDPVLQVLDELEFSNVRVRDALLRTAGAGDLLSSSLDLATNAWQENVALTNEAELRYSTFHSQLTIAWNRIKDVSITIGTALLPVLLSMLDMLDPVIGILANMAEMFATLPIEIQATITTIALLTAGIGPVLFAMGQMVLSINAIAGAMSGLNIAIGPLGIAIAGLVAIFVAAGTAIKAWSDSISKEIDDIVRSTNDFTASMDGIAAATQNIINSGNLQEMSSLLGEQTTQLELAREKLDAARQEMERLDNVEAKLIETGNDHGRQLEKLKEDQENASLAFNQANIEVNKLEKSTDEIKDAMREWQPAIKDSEEVIKDQKKEVSELELELLKWESRLGFLKTEIAAIEITNDSLNRSIDISIGSFGDIADSIGDVTDNLNDAHINAALYDMALEVIKEGNEEATKAADDYRASLDRVNGMFNGIRQSITNLAPLIDSVFGEGAADTLSTFAGAAQDGFNAFASFQSGDIIGGITSSISALTQVMSLFGGEKIEEKLDNIFEKFANGEGTIRDLTKATNELSGVLAKVGSSSFDVARVTDIMNENFGRFVDAARDFGDEGLLAITQVVAAAEEAGVGLEVIAEKLHDTYTEFYDILEERNEFLLEQTTSMIEGINTLIGDGTDVVARDVEFAAESVVQAFAAMVSAGMPITDILAEIGDEIATLTNLGTDMSLNLGEDFDRLGEMMIILSDEHLSRVIEKLEATGQVALAAGNMSLLSADQFNTFANRVENAFNQLTEGGLTSVETIATLAPQLQILNDLSQQYNFSLNENTQALIDQGIEQGVVTDKALTMEDILIRGFDAMLEGVNALIVALGGVPIAFQSWTDSALDTGDVTTGVIEDIGNKTAIMVDDMTSGWQETFLGIEDGFNKVNDTVTDTYGDIVSVSTSSFGIIDGAMEFTKNAAIEGADMTLAAWTDSISQVPGIVNNMMDELDLDIEFNVIPPNIGGGGSSGGPTPPFPEFRTGSLTFKDFSPQGTPVLLHGREQVVTEAQGQSLATMVGNAIRDASGGGASGNSSGGSTNITSLFERQLGKQDIGNDLLRLILDNQASMSREIAGIRARNLSQNN